RYFCPTCPPCHVCDFARAMCVYTCPQCSTCATRMVQTTGETISVCENGCTPDQGVCRHDRCCRPLGASCAHGEQCCNGYCTHGICSCIGPNGACDEDRDCCQTSAFSNVRCADVICHDTKPLGSICSSTTWNGANLDCFPGQCFDGTCRCCATPCEVGNVHSAGLCCEYPRVPLCQPDSDLGKGFVRCCTPGLDCVGDPTGPPAAPAGAAPKYDQGIPKLCH
ncbi:MAG: hypothetical protein ACR2OO_07340, partial [Thermomicrobiales bacterium]